MVILGGWVFFMSEVPLQAWAFSYERGTRVDLTAWRICAHPQILELYSACLPHASVFISHTVLIKWF